MKRFAKLFETPETQVLIHYSRDENGEFPKIYRWLTLECEVGIHLSWTDDTEESWDAADKAFEDFDQAAAEKLVAGVKKLFPGNVPL